jgi:hypothetical protein
LWGKVVILTSSCHPEQSEGSHELKLRNKTNEMFRFAQHDSKMNVAHVKSGDVILSEAKDLMS